MSTAPSLPLTQTVTPSSQDELAEIVQQAFASETPLYPLGGKTSLEFGLPASESGWGLSMSGLNKVIDYPSRDMTITVEAGITMRQLADTLAAERQQLPVDVPLLDQATLGGVVASNWNGPRRYGMGTLRDYVIGIHAVDGRGRPFKGGGRVVKNVAGYDFCKLLTGSMGTLAVITQLTLKLKPLSERSLLVAVPCADLETLERHLEGLVHSQTTPVAIEVLAGPAWDEDPVLSSFGTTQTPHTLLLIGLEGTRTEVDWMRQQLALEWKEQGAAAPREIPGEEALGLWNRLVAFPAVGESPLVIKASVVPSGTTRMIAAIRELDPQCSIQAHAGNGIVIARFSEFPASGLSRALIGQLHPVANSLHGNVVVLSNPSGSEMTHQSVWGGIDVPFGLMTTIKQQFDPKNLLNPGRFVYQ